LLAALMIPALQTNKVLRLGVTFAHLNVFVVLGFLSFMTQKQSHLWGSSTTNEKPHTPAGSENAK
jgi:hypothetical protein